MNTSRSSRADLRFLAWWGFLVAIVILLGVIVARDQIADHFGFGLPGRAPTRLTYVDRYYQAGECRSEEYLKSIGSWPLRPTGTIQTLFGPSYPILTGRTIDGLAPTVVFVSARPDCYTAYSLEGGP